MEDLFEIFRVNKAELITVTMLNDMPHRHGFEELIIGVKGRLEHFIDFNLSEVDSPFASFIAKGKVHKIRPSFSTDEECDLWIICFKSEFIPKTAFQLYSDYHNSANISFSPGPRPDRLAKLCELIADEMKEDAPDYPAVRNLLCAILNLIESERRKVMLNDNGFKEKLNNKFKDFLMLVEENYYNTNSVSFYAEKLFMSVRNLNLICQDILEKSVSEIIESRKIIAAMDLLTNTDNSVAEIGFSLGYTEKSYFTSVFKRKTGWTPTQFKDHIRNLLS